MNTEIFKQMSNADINTIIDGSQPFVKLMTYYGCALREVETKLQVLNDEFKLTHDRNPIESIKSRIKTPQSIVDKLERRGIEANVSNPEEYIRTIERELLISQAYVLPAHFPMIFTSWRSSLFPRTISPLSAPRTTFFHQSPMATAACILLLKCLCSFHRASAI